MKALQSLMSRRQLLRGGATLGLASLVPATLMLSACGGDSTAAPSVDASAKRETRTLQFDLSAAPISEPRLHLQSSKHHREPLVAHTAESRAAHRLVDPSLASIPDERLTHYLSDVDVPALALQQGRVSGKHPVTGAPLLALTFLHVPTASLDKVAARRKATPLADRQPKSLSRASARLRATAASATLPAAPGLHDAPRAVATSLVFSHPSIMNLDADLGADIIDRINNLPTSTAPYSATLIQHIGVLLQQNGYPKVGKDPAGKDSWAYLVPRLDAQGQPVVDAEGDTVYSYVMNPSLVQYVSTLVRQILNSINNDDLFSGSNWQPRDTGPDTTPKPVAAPALTVTAAAVQSTFKVMSSLRVGSRNSGIRFHSIDADDNRNVKLVVSNEFLRSAGCYVQFLDANDAILPVAEPGSLDASDAKFVTLISPDIQMMGIPFLGAAAPTTDVNFAMPANAVTANVFFGGLGMGGSNAFNDKAFLGTLCTLILNLGLPAACLAAGINEVMHEGLIDAISSALNDPVTFKLIAKGVTEALGEGLGSSIQTASTTLSLQAFLGGVGELALDIFLQCCPRIATLLAAFTTASAVQDALPVIGLAMWALSTAADVASISETFFEIFACSALEENVITLSMPQTVTIYPDPSNYEFPATATQYQLRVTYDGAKCSFSALCPISAGRSDPLTIGVGQAMSGGRVVAEVWFFNDSHCLLGYGKSESLVNLPATASNVPVTIQEYLISLDQSTHYQHDRKLVYQAGALAWSRAAAPANTWTSLEPASDGGLNALHGLTVHTSSGMAGYAFAAGGQGISLCSKNPATSVHSIRNVFLGDNPGNGAKLSACGETQPMAIVYSSSTPALGGNNFFLQPAGNFYQLRSVDLSDGSGDFDMNQATTWGYFSNAMEKLCVVNGHVVGISRDLHKIEVLQLPQKPMTSSDLTSTLVSFSSFKAGFGFEDGLLDTPVALCASGDLALVLEQGNFRVQAFGVDGSAVKIFQVPDTYGEGGTPVMASTINLASYMPQGGATLIDIACEGLGYIYVLWYADDGSSSAQYNLDIFAPNGVWLSRTSGVAAGALAVDTFRNIYTLNYETVNGAPVVQPSLSQWLPHSTTTPCGPVTQSVRTVGAANAVPVAVCGRNNVGRA